MLAFRIHPILASIAILACWTTFAYCIPVARIVDTAGTGIESITTRSSISISFEYTGTGRIQSSLVQSASKQSVQDLLDAKKSALGISSGQIKANPQNSLYSPNTFATDVPFRFTFRGRGYTAVAKGNGYGEIKDSYGRKI
ncbi:hypothetical protein GGU10DRAFT_379541 [Lentinula aff. detonsa]|uniref:Uncharacterized protein n=1 Tax=Lentinula aff. detonsa TaxID=2804958 RepID=A0AA38KX48_9AGAR|nr:hypothetical protein GGU10DRAFT_379541 [Lentinula aff. detonsa]